MQNKPQNPDDLLPDEENLSDPYQVIAAFFDLCSVSSHRRHIYTWLEAVNQNDYWRESCPSELLFYYGKLVHLIRAVHLIYERSKERKTAIDLLKEKGYDVETNLLHPALYFGWGRYDTIWDHFPRSLNMEEYIDPYLVLPQFFELYDLNEWCKELNNLLSGGLSSDNPAEFLGQDQNMLLIQKNLLKLIEAVHLIDVREVEDIEGFKKKYPFTLNIPCDGLSILKVLRIELKKENKLLEKMELVENSEDDEEYEYEGSDDENENCADKKTESPEKGRNDDDKGRQKTAFIEIIIQGNCIINDCPVSFEPVKINIPVKELTAEQ